jgi:hypothetical protein
VYCRFRFEPPSPPLKALNPGDVRCAKPQTLKSITDFRLEKKKKKEQRTKKEGWHCTLTALLSSISSWSIERTEWCFLIICWLLSAAAYVLWSSPPKLAHGLCQPEVV